MVAGVGAAVEEGEVAEGVWGPKALVVVEEVVEAEVAWVPEGVVVEEAVGAEVEEEVGVHAEVEEEEAVVEGEAAEEEVVVEEEEKAESSMTSVNFQLFCFLRCYQPSNLLFTFVINDVNRFVGTDIVLIGGHKMWI